MQTLLNLQVGESAVIEKINAEPSLKNRLTMLGIREGEKLYLMQKVFFSRTLLIRTPLTTVGLNKTTANWIFVGETQ